jgi:hypothetical protein
MRAYGEVLMWSCALDHVLEYDGPRVLAPAVERFRFTPLRRAAPTCFTEAVSAWARGWRPRGG